MRWIRPAVMVAFAAGIPSGCCSNQIPVSWDELQRTKMEMLGADSVTEDDKSEIEDELHRVTSGSLPLGVLIDFWDDTRYCYSADVPSGEPGDTMDVIVADIAQEQFYRHTGWAGLATQPEMKEWWGKHARMSSVDIIMECKSYPKRTEPVVLPLNVAGRPKDACSNRIPESWTELQRAKVEMLGSAEVTLDDKRLVRDDLFTRARVGSLPLGLLIEYWDDTRYCFPVPVPSGEPGNIMRVYVADVVRELFCKETGWSGLATRPGMIAWWQEHARMSMLDIVEECKTYRRGWPVEEPAK